ncbi:hypothetical protein WMF18_33540 [Sorangium sp. So ce315]|uniref:hypothetical protein n=1 Tax=Sorangium sp. So ce315 TaxID=3133299 RepID=UPI003F5FF047
MNLSIVGANPAISGRPDDSVTLPAAPTTTVEQAAPATSTRPEAALTTPPVSSPRQVLVATLTQTIVAAHAAGDLVNA